MKLLPKVNMRPLQALALFGYACMIICFQCLGRLLSQDQSHSQSPISCVIGGTLGRRKYSGTDA